MLATFMSMSRKYLQTENSLFWLFPLSAAAYSLPQNVVAGNSHIMFTEPVNRGFRDGLSLQHTVRSLNWVTESGKLIWTTVEASTGVSLTYRMLKGR